jgi:AcrR family transcriptional regulator
VSPPLSPRKSPRQARAVATRDAILGAAAHIIARGGLAAFNTNAVAERAGVSIGSLYQYFPNKDALMVALIQRGLGRQLENFGAAIEATSASAPLPVVVRTLVRAAMQHHHDNSLLATAIDHEEARLPIQAELDSNLLNAGKLVRAVLELHRAEIAHVNIDHAIRTLPTLVRAVTDAWANLSPPQLGLAEDEAVRAVFGYLTTLPEDGGTPSDFPIPERQSS